MSDAQTTVRLLPWSTPEGKPCFLAGDGTGYVSRVADTVESVQLGMADDLLGHATDMLSDSKLSAGELRFLATELTAALRDTRRVAVSRGARLAAAGRGPEYQGDDAFAGG
ncbi:hypothetical protein ACWGJW_05740 [Streptomyces nigrescens]